MKQSDRKASLHKCLSHDAEGFAIPVSFKAVSFLQLGSSAEHHLDFSFDPRAPGRADDDRNVPAELGQTVHHLGFAYASKLAAQEGGQFGLGNAENPGRLCLAQFTALDDVADF